MQQRWEIKPTNWEPPLPPAAQGSHSPMKLLPYTFIRPLEKTRDEVGPLTQGVPDD